MDQMCGDTIRDRARHSVRAALACERAAGKGRPALPAVGRSDSARCRASTFQWL